MDQHFTCNCGGSAWVDRENDVVIIACKKCGTTASGETKSLARDEWGQKQRRLKKQDEEIED